jgi:hypothetical protein
MWWRKIQFWEGACSEMQDVLGLAGFLLGGDLVAVVWFFFVIIKEITHVFRFS